MNKDKYEKLSDIIDKHINITGVAIDSRLVKPGDIFFAIPGIYKDGRNYIYEAIDRGANLVLAEYPCVIKHKKVLQIHNLSAKANDFVNEFHMNPSKMLNINSVTGTNGKSSIVYITSSLLNSAQKSSAMIGTIGVGKVGLEKNINTTTPDIVTLNKLFSNFIKIGIKNVCMEVSSHSLEQQRFGSLEFFTRVFTNLTHDHLDYHKTFNNYSEAKKKLFNNYKAKYSIINIDDKVGEEIYKDSKCNNKITYSLQNPKATFFVSTKQFFINKTIFILKTPNGIHNFETKLIGDFNLYNLIASIAVLYCYGLSLDSISRYIKVMPPPPGRMNLIKYKNSPSIFIDYAHTPDALEKVLKLLKQYTKNKLFCIFGCGGDRDIAKRSKMGQIAETYSDFTILTNDNPRSEPQEKIISDIKNKIIDPNKFKVIYDREKAIDWLIKHSLPNDIILIAGKGHENSQIIGTKSYYFSDSNTVVDSLNSLS